MRKRPLALLCAVCAVGVLRMLWFHFSVEGRPARGPRADDEWREIRDALPSAPSVGLVVEVDDPMDAPRMAARAALALAPAAVQLGRHGEAIVAIGLAPQALRRLMSEERLELHRAVGRAAILRRREQ